MKTIQKIPYTNLVENHLAIKNELLAVIEKVFSHGQFILGPEVKEFEEQFAKRCGTQFALGVGNGTDAIIMALRALGIQKGDEVITVANTFVSTVSSIVMAGATPVFVDVREDYNIDPDLIEKAITPRTKAILPVHLTGRPCEMDSIQKIAKKHNLKIIEDCAQATGAEYRSQHVGSFGEIGCFSLHPLKILNACGDGGVVVTNDARLYETCKILRDNGMKSRGECVLWSSNSRLDTIHAAMLLVKFKYLDGWIEKCREHARHYQKRLQAIPQVVFPTEKSYEKVVYHTFVIQSDHQQGLVNYLAQNGISTKIHYPVPIHFQSAAKDLGYRPGSLPVTEKLAKRIISLPLYAGLDEEKIDYISQTIKNFYKT